jgi:hypothetical protein
MPEMQTEEQRRAEIRRQDAGRRRVAIREAVAARVAPYERHTLPQLTRALNKLSRTPGGIELLKLRDPGRSGWAAPNRGEIASALVDLYAEELSFNRFVAYLRACGCGRDRTDQHTLWTRVRLVAPAVRPPGRKRRTCPPCPECGYGIEP